jgi:hypothetical protein
MPTALEHPGRAGTRTWSLLAGLVGLLGTWLTATETWAQPIPPGATIMVRSRLHGQVLDIQGGNRQPGAAVISYPGRPTQNDNQTWELVPGPGGAYFVQSRLNGLVLDIQGGSRAPSARVIMWPAKPNRNANQLWDLSPGPRNAYWIRSRLNGFVLDVHGANRTPGTPIIVYPAHANGADNQLWDLVPAAAVVQPPPPPPPPPYLPPPPTGREHRHLIGVYDAIHPHWRDVVIIEPDGSYRRGSGDSGRWSFDGSILVLHWTKWGPETLVKHGPGHFVAPSNGFAITRRPGGQIATPPPPPPYLPPPPPPYMPPPPPPPPRSIQREAGPIWNNGDANSKCPAVCGPGMRWSGQWRTTVPGRMSVCECVTP